MTPLLPAILSVSPIKTSSAKPAECAIIAPEVELVESVFVDIVTTPADEIAIAFVSDAEPRVPSSGITIFPPVVINPPPVKVPETVRFPAELKDMVSAAAAEAAVLKLSFVALLEELKSPSDTASIPAATRIASVPVPSSGA